MMARFKGREMEAIPDAHRAISSDLIRAREKGRAFSGPPQGLPDSMEAAYRLQDHSIAAWDDEIGGWKVGGVPPAYTNRFDERFLAGPIFVRSIRHASASEATSMPVYSGGFAAIEPEFVLQLGENEDEDRIFIGAEIASSPIPAINDHGPMAVISDFGNNNGLLLGPEINAWRHGVGPISVKTMIDGREVGAKRIAGFPRAALGSLFFPRRLAEQRGYALPAGIYVSTGAITGVHESGARCVRAPRFRQLGKH